MSDTDASHIRAILDNITIREGILTDAIKKKFPESTIQKLSNELADETKKLPSLNKITQIDFLEFSALRREEFLARIIKTQKEALNLIHGVPEI